jgi:hypothetical protein
MRFARLLVVAGLAALPMVDNADASPITCGGSVQFSLEVTSGSIGACVTGNGNLQNLPEPYTTYAFFDRDLDFSAPSPNEEWFTINTQAKSFTINASAWTGFDSMALLLHMPTPSPKPDWALFILSGGVTNGTWSNTGTEALVHASLYRHEAPEVPGSTEQVPEPASLSLTLLGAGVTLAARHLRSRRHA